MRSGKIFALWDLPYAVRSTHQIVRCTRSIGVNQGELADIEGEEAIASGMLAAEEGDDIVAVALGSDGSDAGDDGIAGAVEVVGAGVDVSPGGTAFLHPASTDALMRQMARTEVVRMINSWRCARRTQAWHFAHPDRKA